ncbi:MAG: histidine kinase [Bacteroidetes bacterium]|nr:histidine kinase [Bacteroidota bacterium]MDA1120755.1 histidine kinase [Bacteroidota bacterium]
MDHPFLLNANRYYFITMWVAISAAHIFLLRYFFETSMDLAVADSLSFNILFAGLSFSYWFAVRFSSNLSPTFAMINHIVGGIFIVGLCFFLSNYFLNQYFNITSEYTATLMPVKLFAGLFYYTVIVLIYYMVKYYFDLQEKINSESRLAAAVKEAELNMLKFQINPHFIFNSLNSISALTLNKPEKARDMILKLSDFMRYSVKNKQEEIGNLTEELKNIMLYLDIEKVRFGDKLDIQMDISPDAETCQLPNMILQPLMENAIKYGVYESTESSMINLIAKLADGILHIEIKNSFDSSGVPAKGQGIGLKNVSHRMQLIYDRDDLTNVYRNENLFIVTLKIPQIPSA